MIISEWGAGSGTFRQWQELWKEECRNCLAVFDVVLPFGSSTLEAKGFGEKLTGDAGRKDGNTEDVMNIWYNPLPDQAYKAGSWGYI